MKSITIAEKNIQGISIRTTNANEMNPETAKIAALYKDFDQNIVVDYQHGARVYGVYFDYESDANGLFSVLAGADRIESSTVELQQVKIVAGDYLVFKGEGEMPQAVIDTWIKIWDFFSESNTSKNADKKADKNTDDSIQYKRAYKTDFEFYKSESQVEIHIGIEKQ